MKLKTDYRKIKAILIIGVALCLCAVITYLKFEGIGKDFWTWFLFVLGFLFIAIGLLVRSEFTLTDTYLEVNNMLGWSRRRINLSDIQRTKTIDKQFPMTAYLNNPIWLILTDKKFKRIKKFKLFSNKGKLFTIDGHLLIDSDYEHLKKKLKK
ncbi:hypothetical protein FAZ15_19940 [Sphingobacterium olei]|uniref:Uncharacterized protein n=1 Tax=Sphingobacterium olei TaxID=2571155 RepID=A0A4U0NCS8_9SPHI|nr:EbsA family protein [Sphingobacterium olei]TJZ51821.1 hypothetical protein FAZ15_19940 [Sphingobacterium olei]